MKNSPLRLLSFAIGLLIGNLAHAQEFNQMVIFGDSLTDTGRFKELNAAHPIVSFGTFLNGVTLQNSFTTNPNTTWAGHLATSYGVTANAHTTANPNGTNYAVGNSRVAAAQTSTNSPPITEQIDDYLSNNTANPNALYAVWIGANDLLAAADANSQAEQLSIITTAASQEANQINRLANAGANYILVPNLPDVGITQRYASDPAGAATATQGARLYNSTLYRALNDSSANVIPANTFALLQETINNYEAFGFKVSNSAYGCQATFPTSLTSISCSQDRWVSSTANEDYVFADEIHPSGRTHRILGQYYRSLIESPSQMAGVIGKLTQSGSVAHQNLYRKLNSLDSYSHSLWVDGYISNAQLDDDKLDKPSVSIGFDIANPNQHSGIYLSHQKQEHTLSHTISADSKEIGVGFYHQHDFGNVRLNADIGVSKIDLDTTRNVNWDGAARVHHANGEGRRHHVGLQLGYSIAYPDVVVRPYVGVHAQRISIKDLSEDNANLSTALQYDLPTQNSLQGNLGVDVEYQLRPSVKLSAGLGHSHEFKDDDMTVSAKLPSLTDYHRTYHLPVAYQDADSTYAHLGATLALNRVNLSAGLTATHADGGTNAGGYVSLQAKF